VEQWQTLRRGRRERFKQRTENKDKRERAKQKVGPDDGEKRNSNNGDVVKMGTIERKW